MEGFWTILKLAALLWGIGSLTFIALMIHAIVQTRPKP